MTYNQITPLILFASTAPASIGNEYAQYGFLGILLTLLIWYSRKSYLEGVRREASDKEAKEVLTKRCAEEKKEIVERYEKSLDEERDRYHELHVELLNILKSKYNA